jgi:hypothetical protein
MLEGLYQVICFRSQESQPSRSLAPIISCGRFSTCASVSITKRTSLLHRLRCGNPQSGPIFANAVGKPLALTSIVSRVITPALNLCERCHKRETDHGNAEHEHKRDERIPVWHGWHAARRGLGSNLYRLGVPDIVIQRILRHANVSTTATYYIKTAADDVRGAMAKLEKQITERTVNTVMDISQPPHDAMRRLEARRLINH